MQHQQPSQESLSRPDSLILVGLVDGPKHAVALREAIEQVEGVFIEPGTLYRVLAHLEQRGWIEGLHAEGPLRRYRITALGMLALASAEAGCQREKPREGGRPVLLRGKETIVRLVMWMLRLYPPAWRERYETEMVALLEQHHISFWTVVDLLVGALDARLDPHYRRSRQLLPWRRLASACMAFQLGFLLWIVLLYRGIFPGPSAAPPLCQYPGDAYQRCMLRVAVGAHTPAILQALLLIALLKFFCFVVALGVWVVGQTIRHKQRWNLLRLFPIASFFLLAWTQPFLLLSGWRLLVLGASLALLVESGGAMLTAAMRWQEGQGLSLARVLRPLALFETGGMALLCISSGVWLVSIWNLFPQINLYYPGTQMMVLLGSVLMVLATLTALVEFVRSAGALKAVDAVSPKQEPRHQDHERG